MDPRSDEALMVAHTRGDAGAFRELFARWSPKLLRMMQRSVPRNEDARDLVQQTFLQLHRARNDFRPGAALRPWLYTIALNLQRQYWRRLGRRPETSLSEDSAAEPAASGGDPEERVLAHQLRRALANLPRNQREVIELHWFEGLAFKEVAEVVGASTSAVKVRAHRGYARLRQLLEPFHVTSRRPTAYPESEGSERT